MSRPVLPPGSWPSPISAAMIARGGLRLGQPQIHGQAIYWLEGRAAEQGRTVLVRARPGQDPQDVSPAPLNLRSGAQEYGGGVFCIDDDVVYCVDFPDHGVYALQEHARPRRVAAPGERRLADLCLDQPRRRLVAVSEDHGVAGEPATTLIGMGLADGAITTLAQGADFYSSPCLDRHGRRLAWLQWNHPDMPWDATTLHVADNLGRPGLLASRAVAGGAAESIFQPRWGADGALYFMSDRSGWWNLHRWDGQQVEPLMRETADCGFAQWVFGMSSWGFVGEHEVLCCGAHDGIWSLALVDVMARTTRWLDLPFNTVEHVATGPGRAAIIAASADLSLSVIALDLGSLNWQVLRNSNRLDIGAEWISNARPFRFATSDEETAHAFYYPPRHTELVPEQNPPPLLVKCHGGPTAHADAGLDWRIQFWTSRGFAVVDVNYRGSSGFGRRYREKLHGRWGIVDVADALNAARHLVDKGLADPERLAISGGSAGGYTVLCALTFHELFKAGASLYGVSELESLLQDTHKFEARYLDRLVGPWPTSRAEYRQRSPLSHADQLSCPVIFMQGLKDRVVTPDQSERMAAALRAKGLPVLYITFADEGHGFRQAENIATALEAELYFYSRIFGFDAPGISFQPPIDNLDDQGRP